LAQAAPGSRGTWLSFHAAAMLLSREHGYEHGCRTLTAALIEGELYATLEPGVDAMTIRPDEWERLFQQGYYIDWDTGNVALPVGIDTDDILFAPRVSRQDVERVGRHCRGA